ncbi:FAS1 domain-containing protein [Scleroderma yunnanense]
MFLQFVLWWECTLIMTDLNPFQFDHRTNSIFTAVMKPMTRILSIRSLILPPCGCGIGDCHMDGVPLSYMNSGLTNRLSLFLHNMRILTFTPFLLLGTAYALPTLILPWLGQIQLDSIISYLGSPQLDEERTVYQLLKEDEHFSRLVKAIELNDGVVDFLNDPSQSITFFAVPNSGLPKPRKPRDPDHNGELDVNGDECHNHSDLDRLVLQVEQLDDLPDSGFKEDRKRCFARIVRGILAYHILPERYSSHELLENSTYATNLTLKDGSMDYQPLRLTVERSIVPPGLKVNMHSFITARNIEAKNGVIHHINRPLIPPPSIFQQLFLLQDIFSRATSAIQRVGLTGHIDRRYFHGKDESHGGFHGAKTATFFAPTNSAFRRLPRKLQFWLFSPFGERALRKLLEFHIVPDFALFSDYIHHATSEDDGMTGFVTDDLLFTLPTPVFPPMTMFKDNNDHHPRRNPIPLPELIYEFNITLPTLLTNHTLDVHIARYKSKLRLPGPPRFFTRFKVNGREVVPFDFPARNGATHVVTTLLNPLKKHHCHHRDHKDHDDEEVVDTAWEDWEEWLPQWAMED